MQPTNIHRLIATQQGWLNTSRPLTAEDLAGRIILLDFWTYCCINCMHVIPDLQYLEEKFGDKLTVIGIHSAKFKNERDSENIRQAILRYGIHHAVVNDFDFKVWQGFGVRAWPTFVLINPKGMIEEMYSGEGNREAAAHDIEALIKKYSAQLPTTPLPIALEKDKQPPTVLSFPGKLAYSSDLDGKEILFVSEAGNHRISIMTLDGKIIETIGNGTRGMQDGAFAQASFNAPQGVLYKDGLLYVADTSNHSLRLVDFKTRTVSTIAGNGKQGYERSARNKPALEISLASPWDLEFYPDDKHIAIAMAGTHQLWSYDIDAKTVSVLAGNGRESIDDGSLPYNSLSQPSGLSAVGSKLYFVDSETSSLRVLENGSITTLIGTGLFDFGYAEGKQGEALMQHALGVYATPSDVYVADSYNHSIRRFDPKTGELLDFAGHGVRGSKNGTRDASEFNEPNDVLLVNDKLYIADTNNNAIRIIDLKGKSVTTLAVSEAQRASAPEFTDKLPNAEKVDALEITDAATIHVGLKDGWKINKDAPSYLALFDDAKKPAANFDLEAVRKQDLKLSLKPGAYQLQSTLYYCEDKEGAQCLIKSFDVPVTVKEGGDKEVVLKLN